MKFNKIFALALGVLAFSSCCDDCDYNTAPDVTVELKETEMRFPEDRATITSLYNIPLVVKGEANGNLVVNVAFKAVGESQAEYDKHYVVTSTSIIIPEGETSVNVEFYPTGDDFINENRTFEISIESVEGGEVGANKSCVVTLVDNEGLIPRLYDEVQGDWIVKFKDVRLGDIESMVTIIGAEEGQPGYQKTVNILNFPDGQHNTNIPCSFSVDGATECPILIFNLGVDNVYGEDVDPELGIGKVIFCHYSGNSLYDGGSVVFQGNPECDEFTWTVSPDFEGVGLFYDFPAGFYIGYRWSSMTLTK